MASRKVFSDSIVALPKQEGLAPNGMLVNTALPGDDQKLMTVHFRINLPANAQEQMEALVAKGEVASPEQLQSAYSASQDDVDKLVAWLKGEGFTITQISPDRTSVYAQATSAQIQKSLDVNMVRVTVDGITYTAAQTAPSLPSDVGANVQEVLGLQPFVKAHKNIRQYVPPQGVPRLPKNKDGEILSMAVADMAAPAAVNKNVPPYLVSEILRAYGADGLAATGKGQIIAILIDTFPLDSDLEAFWQANGLSVTIGQVVKINVTGQTLGTPEGEETLDASWSTGIAPGATIRIYATGTLQFTDMDRGLDQIIADAATMPGLRQVSISLGLGERFVPAGEITTQHQKYLRLAAAGVNVFVSSGDAGSNPDATGHGTATRSQTEYGSSDSCVVGVGGTSLVLAANGGVASEVAWPSGGGGKSGSFKRPVWQKGAGLPAGTWRAVPDVSLAADPNEGCFLVLNGKPSQYGGTSWSAPMWAGFCALMNEARLSAGKPALPFLCPLLYPLLGTSCFRDITAGSNGAYSAGPGYDMVTGLGVPNVKALIAALTA